MTVFRAYARGSGTRSMVDGICSRRHILLSGEAEAGDAKTTRPLPLEGGEGADGFLGGELGYSPSTQRSAARW